MFYDASDIFRTVTLSEPMPHTVLTACVTARRMEQAAALLRDTDEKTYLIAEKTGYLDPNYFSYVFKRHFGLTPSKYRAGQRS